MFSLAFFQQWNLGFVGTSMLLAKLTILLALFLLIIAFLKRQSAAHRHSILTLGLIAVPLLLALHIFAPAWYVPGSASLISTVNQESNNPPDQPANPIAIEKERTQDVEGNPFLASRIPLDQSHLFEKNDALATQQNTQEEPVSVAPLPEPEIVSSDSPASGFQLGLTLSLIWLIGTVLWLLRIAFAWTVVHRTVRRSESLDTTKLSESTQRLLKEVASQGITLKVANSIDQTPLGFGIFRKTILFPQTCHQWNSNQWRSVVLHEYAHFLRHDCLINLIARIQQSLLWFHPLVWTYVNQIRAESENACDNFVIQSGVSRIDYADVLFQVAKQSVSNRITAVATVTMSDATQLESRITSILSTKTLRNPVKPVSFILATVLLAAISIPIATAQFGSALNSSEPIVELTTESGLEGLTTTEDGLPTEEISTSEETQANQALANTQLLFFVTLNNGESFIGNLDGDLEIESSFGRSFIDAKQISILKSQPDSGETKNRFKIETSDGSTLFGAIKKSELNFDTNEGKKTVSLNSLTAASLIGRSGLIAETVSDGFAKNKMSYHIRAPQNYDPAKKFPAIVMLHGENANAKTLIESVAKKWPKIAKKYLLIGINGERKSEEKALTNRPRYNYTYVNFVGGSKYKGFPGTERESPALVAEVIKEIRDYVPISTVFLGGPDEGGWLTYSMYMNYPNLIDGAFPITGAMIIQCQPDAYDDETLRGQQRDTPIAIIHPTDDKTLDQIYGKVAYERYLYDSFPMLTKMVAPAEGDELGGKNFYRAILWLDSMSRREESEIKSAMQHLIGQNRPRDAVGLLTRIDLSKKSKTEREQTIHEAEYGQVSDNAAKFAQLIDENKDGSWINDFINFRETYEFAPSAKKAMDNFDALRKTHDQSATEIYDEAKDLYEKDEKEEAFKKFEQIVNEFYASKHYRSAKKKLAERDSAGKK